MTATAQVEREGERVRQVHSSDGTAPALDEIDRGTGDDRAEKTDAGREDFPAERRSGEDEFRTLESRDHGPQKLDAVDDQAGADFGIRLAASARAPKDSLLALCLDLWAGRRALGRITLASAASVLILTLLTPNSYLATTSLMPPDSAGSSSLATMAGIASRLPLSDAGIKGDLLNGTSNGEVFVGILRSRSAQEAIVEQFDLRTAYGHPWLGWRASREDARRELERNTDASADRKSGIISISVEDHDRRRAAAMAKAYVNQLNRLQSSLTTSAGRREREFLEKRLQQVKTELDAATRELSVFSSVNGAFDPKEEAQAMVESASRLQGELIAAEAERKGLGEIYAPDNVRMRSLQSRIVELQRQLHEVSRGDPKAEPGRAGRAAAEMPFPSLEQLPLLGATYSDLYRRAKIEEAVYQALTQQYEAARVQEAKEIPAVRELDSAEVPEKKWAPHRAILTLLGALSGLLFGAVWVAGRANWKRLPPENPYRLLAKEMLSAGRTHWLYRKARPWFLRAA